MSLLGRILRREESARELRMKEARRRAKIGRQRDIERCKQLEKYWKEGRVYRPDMDLFGEYAKKNPQIKNLRNNQEEKGDLLLKVLAGQKTQEYGTYKSVLKRANEILDRWNLDSYSYLLGKAENVIYQLAYHYLDANNLIKKEKKVYSQREIVKMGKSFIGWFWKNKEEEQTINFNLRCKKSGVGFNEIVELLLKVKEKKKKLKLRIVDRVGETYFEKGLDKLVGKGD